MASRKSRSNVPPLAPRGKGRLAAFSAYVENAAHGLAPATDAALARALDKRGVTRCAMAWNRFSQQVAAAADNRRPAVRVTLPSDMLPPLP